MSGESALVIGGTGGIGEAVIRSFAKKGIRVSFTYCKNESKARELEGLTDIIRGYQTDFTQPASLQETLGSILKTMGKIDVVVLALATPIHLVPFLQTDWKEFQTHIDVQVRGLYEVVKALEPQLKLKHRTKILVLLTEACNGNPPSRMSGYMTAKYGLMGFAKSLAAELASYCCTVNMISPGMTETALITNFPAKMIEFAAESHPLKRIGKPEDVAEVVDFLISPAADHLNGVNHPVALNAL